MSFTGTLIVVSAAAAAYWVVRSVLEPGLDADEEGHGQVTRQPGSRATPARGTGPRQTGMRRDEARKTSTAPRGRPAAAPRRDDEDEYPWYVILDVPRSAGRAEVHEALRRHLARARADGDRAAISQLMRAAASVTLEPRRNRSTGARS